MYFWEMFLIKCLFQALLFISRLVFDTIFSVLFSMNFRDVVKNWKPKVYITLEVVLVVEKKGHDTVRHLCLGALRKHGKPQTNVITDFASRKSRN